MIESGAASIQESWRENKSTHPLFLSFPLTGLPHNPGPPSSSMNTRGVSLIKSDSMHNVGSDLSQWITVIRLNYIIMLHNGLDPLLFSNNVRTPTVTTFLEWNYVFSLFFFLILPQIAFLLKFISFLFLISPFLLSPCFFFPCLSPSSLSFHPLFLTFLLLVLSSPFPSFSAILV